MKAISPQQLLPALVVLTLILAAACGKPESPAPSQTEAKGANSVITVHGHLPNLSLKEMVAESDAVVIGTLDEELGTKLKHGGNEPRPKFYYQYKDFRLAVEDALYPKDTFPAEIAVLVETGIVSARENQSVRNDNSAPIYTRGEKVLLFLENLKDPKFDTGPGRPVPRGYTPDNYYLGIVTASYGKMEPADGKWRDSRSGKSFTRGEAEQAIQGNTGQ